MSTPAPQPVFDISITTSHHIRDARAVHRALEHDTHAQGRTLWAQPTPRRIIIRTPVAGVAWDRWPHAQSTSVTAASLRYTPGTRIAWALIANPTRSVFIRGQRGKRVALDDADSVIAWAGERLRAAATPDGVDAQRLQPASGASGLNLSRWALSGSATVEDSGAMARLLTEGVGHGRAFGCGLLLVRDAT